MANLQQCSLQSSVQRSSQKRRRRKRYKGKKAVKPLNNSIIEEFSWQRHKRSSNTNNLIRCDTPGLSAVGQTVEKSTIYQTIDLCSDDSTNETINCTNDNTPCGISQQKVTLMDLSSDTSDEVEIIILPNDAGKLPESKSLCTTAHENKPPNTPCPNSKSPNAKFPNNRPKSVILYSRPDNKSPLNTPDTQCSNLKSPNAELPHNKPEDKSLPSKPSDPQSSNSKSPSDKPAINKPPNSVIFHTRPDNKVPPSKLSVTPSLNSKSNDEAANNEFRKSVILHGRLEDKSPLSKPPDDQPCNSKSTNPKPASNRPSKAVLTPSKPEDKSSLSKPVSNQPPECVILDSRPEIKSPPRTLPDSKSPNLKSNLELLATKSPSKAVVLPSKPEDKSPLSKPPESKCVTPPKYEHPNTKPVSNHTPECVILDSKPENKFPSSTLPDTQSSNLKSRNAEKVTDKPSKGVPDEVEIIILSNAESKPLEIKSPCTTPHKNKLHDTRSPNLKSPDAKSANDRPSSVILCSKPEDKSSLSKPSDDQPCNTKSTNTKPATSRPSKAVLPPSKPEDKSPLSKPPEKKHCVTPPKSEHAKAKPVSNQPPECVILDSKPEGKSSYRTLPDTKSPNLKPHNADLVSSRPSKVVVLHSYLDDKYFLTEPPDDQPCNSKSTNTKPATNRPLKPILLRSKPEHISSLSKPPEKKHCRVTFVQYEPTNAKPDTNKPTKCVILDSRPENKSPPSKLSDTQSPNDKAASNRPPKSALLHSKPNDKSPLSKPPEKKRCITPSEYEQPKAKPTISSPLATKSETVVIDISDDGSEADLSSCEKNDTNDEILVIGTFNRKSKPTTVPLKKPSKKIHKKLIMDKTKNLRKDHPRDLHTKCRKEHHKELPKAHTKERPEENPTQGPSKTVRRQRAFDFAEPTGGNSNGNIVKLRRRIKAKYFKKMLQYKKKMEVDLFDTVKYQHLLINNKLSGTELASGVGGNVYINSPVYIPTSGLRPIMIDGSNVAFTSENQYKFSCKRLDICIKYFKEKGHKVTAFVPQFRVQSHQSDNPGLLDQLVRSGDVVLTPSKVIDGKLIVPYDDRFIVQAAVLKGGVIISRDNYKDLLEENPTWAETIKYRTLAYTWVDDVLMFPNDPLGVIGPSLEEFLRFN